MAYQFSKVKKFAPVSAIAVAAAIDTTSVKAFPMLGPGSSGSSASGSSASGAGAASSKPVEAKKLDFKKTVVTAASMPAPVQTIYREEVRHEKVKPSSTVVTHCYDEFGEDYDGPDEDEIDTSEFNANLPVGGRRGGW
jgi:hypothetical protein